MSDLNAVVSELTRKLGLADEEDPYFIGTDCLGCELVGDAGTGGAPSVPLDDAGPDYGPTPDQLKQVEEARKAKQIAEANKALKEAEKFVKNAPIPGTASPPAPGAPPLAVSPSFWQMGLWKDAPVKVWHAGVGFGGALVLVVGMALLGRRRT